MSEPQGLNDFIASTAGGPQVGEPGPSVVPAGLDQFVGDELNREKYGGAEGMALAAAAGAARSISFGLSDQALVRSGLVDAETLKALEEVNPGSSLVGEIGGIAIPAVLSGGTSLAATAAAKTAPSVAAKIAASTGEAFLEKGLINNLVAKNAAAKAIEFTTEGALYGLGQSISENALGDHDLVSEKTLSNIGLSGLLSGATGALVGGFMGSKAQKLVDASTAEEKILAQKIAQQAEPESIQARIANTNLPAKDKLSFIEGLTKEKSNADEIRKAAELIGAPVLPSQTSASKFVQNAETALSQTPSVAGVYTAQTIQRGFDAVENTLRDTLGKAPAMEAYEAGALIKEQIQNTVDKIYEPLKVAYKEREALGKTIDLSDKARLKLYDNLIEKSQSFGSVGSKGGKLIEEYAERALAQNNVSQLDRLITEINSDMGVAKRLGNTEASRALGEVKELINDFQVKQIATQGRQLAREGIEGADDIAKQINSQHQDLTKRYREFKEIMNDLASDARLGRKNMTHGALEEVLEGIPNEKVLDKIFDPKNADGLTRLKKNFPDVFETLASQKKAQLLEANTIDGSIKANKILDSLYNEKKMSSKVRDLIFSPEELEKLKATKTWTDALPKNINPSGTAKTQAYMEFLKNPLSASVENVKGYVIRKLIDTISSPEEAGRLATLFKVGQQAEKASKKIESKISEIAYAPAKSVGINMLSKIASEVQFKEKSNQIRELANNYAYFDRKLQNTTQNLSAHLPNVTASLQNAVIKNVNFLNSKLPAEQPEGIFKQKTEPSKTEISKFNRYYDIVENPTHALDQVKSGTLVPETIETLINCYPKLYNEMKVNLLNEIVSMKNPQIIPFHRRMSISMFLQQPLDSALNPTSILANQTAFATDKSEQAAAMGPVKPTLGGLKEVTLADRTKLGGRWSEK